MQNGQLKVNEYMAGILQDIIQREPQLGTALFDESYQPTNIVCDLIAMYKVTSDLETRELITEFMLEAGYPCLRKLVTRDLTVELPADFPATAPMEVAV